MSFKKLVVVACASVMAVALTGCTTSGSIPGDGGIPICPNDPQRCPDLIPVVVSDKEDLDEGRACDFCRETERDGQRAMEVSVRNQGGIGFHREPPPFVATLGSPDAPASITRVIMTGEGGTSTTVDLPTPAIPVGFSVDLEPVIYPPSCLNQDCHVTIIVDVDKTVVESDEGNNTVTCFLPFVR